MVAAVSPSIEPAPRLADLRRFYGLLDELARHTGGPRRLADCSGRMEWPQRGVYFFMELGEVRTDSGSGPRIVRVGTHALKDQSRTTLWTRLSQHKGQRDGNGNHRGSIFRLLVGAALLADDPALCATWGMGNTPARAVREAERELESRVSNIIGRMPFLFLHVGDVAGAQSLRGVVERNTIALLSNAGKAPLDQPSSGWLGHRCPRERVRASGLWNQNHVDEAYDPAFLDTLETIIRATERRT
ncbi:MAG: hypothetical protein IT364_18575 [Candidatus Hydrogenedentes bacterium]|nr:hypothetical protein [Candidatus Hydrogenedentota bacterium]